MTYNENHHIECDWCEDTFYGPDQMTSWTREQLIWELTDFGWLFLKYRNYDSEFCSPVCLYHFINEHRTEQELLSKIEEAEIGGEFVGP